jgi:hypothetical protein
MSSPGTCGKARTQGTGHHPRAPSDARYPQRSALLRSRRSGCRSVAGLSQPQPKVKGLGLGPGPSCRRLSTPPLRSCDLTGDSGKLPCNPQRQQEIRHWRSVRTRSRTEVSRSQCRRGVAVLRTRRTPRARGSSCVLPLQRDVMAGVVPGRVFTTRPQTPVAISARIPAMAISRLTHYSLSTVTTWHRFTRRMRECRPDRRSVVPAA